MSTGYLILNYLGYTYLLSKGNKADWNMRQSNKQIKVHFILISVCLFVCCLSVWVFIDSIWKTLVWGLKTFLIFSKTGSYIHVGCHDWELLYLIFQLYWGPRTFQGCSIYFGTVNMLSCFWKYLPCHSLNTGCRVSI